MAPPSKTFLLILVLALVAVEGCLATVVGVTKKEEPKTTNTKEEPKKVEKKELRVRIAVRKDTTNFLGRYPEAGTSRVVYGAAYDFLDEKKQFGFGVGKCTVAKVFEEKELKNKDVKGYLETCVFSFDFEKGQIIVVGDINTTLKENILAVTGGTRAFLGGSGQVARRVLPRSEFAFSDTLSEVEYVFQRSNW